jgi:hypothetical protein
MIGTVKLSWHCLGSGHNIILDTVQDMQIELKRFYLFTLCAYHPYRKRISPETVYLTMINHIKKKKKIKINYEIIFDSAIYHQYNNG